MQRPRRETVTLDDIMITEELSRRSPRSPNWQAEAQAMYTLARQMVRPEIMLQMLVDITLNLCIAGTAGVSLLETTRDGEEVFRPNVLGGTLERFVGGSTPRNFSTCGVCLDRGTPVLFSHPERYFTYLGAANTPIVEGLVLPLIADNHALGTIWIMSHDEQRHFDFEDVRVMTSLADFTAAALLLNQRQTQELLAKNAQLEAEIVERKRAEETVRETEAYVRAIANLVTDMLWRNDATGNTSWYNQRWLDYTGQTLEEAQGYGWLPAIHPSDRDRSLANFQNAVDERRPLRQEHRIRSKDGSYRWFQVQAEPVFDADGRIMQWFGAAIDIHDRRMALEALRESEQRLQAIVENLPGGAAFVVDRNLRYVLAEGEALYAAGFKPEDLVGHTLSEVLPPELVANYEVLYRKALAGESFEFEHNAHNRTYISRGTSLRAENGEIYAVLAVSYDITDRKTAEAALIESEQRLRLATEAADMYAWDFDLRTGVPKFSENVERVTGDRPTSNFEENLQRVHPDDRAIVRQAFEDTQSNGDRFSYEMRTFAQDRQLQWFLVSGSLIRDSHNVPVRAIGISQNITERKQAEAALQKANDLFRLAETAANGFVYDWDRQTGIVTRSEGFNQVLGYAPGEIAETPNGWFDLIHPDDRKVLQVVSPDAMSDEQNAFAVEYRVRHKDGNYIDVFDRALKLRESGTVVRIVGSTVDITDRKRTEAALQESEERFRLFVTASSDIVYRMSADWHEMQSLEGKSFLANTDDPSHTWIETYIPPEEQPRVWAAIQEALRTKSMFELEHRVIQRDGAIGWTFSRAIPMLNEQGDIVEWFGTASDVTERKQAEVALRQSEARFRTLANTAPALIWYNDAQGNNLFLNQYFLDFTGRSAEQIRGEGWHNLIHLDDAEFYIADYLAAVREQRSWHNRNRIRRHDGVWRWHDNYAQPLFNADGLYLGHVGVTIDNTNAIEAEIALRESEEKYRSLFDSIDAGFCIFEMLYNDAGEAIDFRYIETNPAFERQSGRRPQPGQTMGELFPEAEDMWLEDYAEVARTGQAKRFIDYHKDLDRWFDVFVFPTSNGKNQLAALFSDVTDEKRSEAALRDREERLRDVLDSMAEGFALLGGDFTILDVNKETLRLDGRSRDELLGCSHWDAFPGTEDSPLGEIYRRVARERISASLEHLYHWSDGRSMWVDTRAYPTRNDGVAIFWCDITDRKRAEAILRESEAKYRTLFESIDEGFAIAEVIYDSAGQPVDILYLEANPAASRLTGVPDYTGRRMSEISPEFGSYWLELYDRVARSGVSERNEQYAAPLNRWYDFYVFPDETAAGSGESRRVAVVFQEITERKHNEEQLRRAAEMDAFRVKLSDALRPLSDAVEIQATVTRTTMNFFGADRCYYCEIIDGSAVIRRDASQADLPSVVGAYPLENSPIFRAMLDAGQPFVFQDVHTTNLLDENLRQTCLQLQIIAGMNAPVIKQGEPVGILAITQTTPRNWTEFEMDLAEEIADRTWATIERTRAEAALRESEGKYRSLFESINDGFALIEVLYDGDDRPVDCRFIEVSPSFEAQTRLSQAQGKTLRELIPSIEPGWFEYYHQALVTNALVHFEMWQEYLKIWFEVDVSPYGNPHDRRVTIVLRNINERKQAEANQIQLIREQAAREQERQRAETLAELDRAKTTFFSNVSHEFRTPLTLLLAPLQDALSDSANPLPQAQQERLELAHRNSLRLLKLVNTLLDFSRIEAGRMEAVYEPTDLALYTTELASVFRSAIERAGLRLIVDCPPLREPVYVDREMWEKIVLNLLSNAFKFTLEGEIAVRLHRADGERVMLQIQDTGGGIPPQDLPHLFERFYQIRGAKARTHEGSGIGLALVHELIRLHGGTIDVSSVVGQGTCFTVTIPLGTAHLPSDRLRRVVGDYITATRTLASTAVGAAPYVEEAERWLPSFRSEGAEGAEGAEEAEEEKSIPTPYTLHPTPSSARIFLVDDNADMREYLTRILSEYVEVEAFADGAAALAAAGERIPDLVLSDVMMPHLDGFGLLKALRADPRTREIPIILLSARAGEEAVVEGLEAGADDYLIKPFSSVELVSRVNAHLAMAQLRSEALRQERTTNRKKDEILSIVSHELNTPLVAILGWTRLLRANPSNQSVLIKSLETIERNATLQAKLIQDLLNISRIEAGKLRLSLEPVELKSLIEMAIAAVLTAAIAKDIHIEWKHSSVHQASQMTILGDRDRLQQVICNLLTNAIKFTPKAGSVTVELSAIEDRNSCDASFAQIRIADTGIGIPAQFLPHVFDRFYQAEGSAGGLGLGLAIARHLVELHNGTIHVESLGKGQGTTFTVMLPIRSQ